MPGYETGGHGIEREVQDLGEHPGRGHGEHSEQGSQHEGIQRWVVDHGGHAGEVRVHIAEAAGERERDPGVQAVVVEHAHEIAVQGDGPQSRDGQCGKRGGAGWRYAGAPNAYASHRAAGTDCSAARGTALQGRRAS